MNHLNKLKCMEAFVRVVDAGGFTAAARQWGVSKAVVSKSVGQLEAHVGAALLLRSTRAMALTEAGARYVEACRDVLDRVAAAEAALDVQHTELSGVLRVSAPSGLFAGPRAAVLASFITRYPAVTLDFEMTNRLVDVVGEGMDCAIRVTPPRDSALIGRRLASIDAVFVASPAYVDDRGAPDDLADLVHHACLCDRGLFAHPDMPAQVGQSGQAPRFFANDPFILRAMALADRGIAHVPRMLVRADLEAGRLRTVLDGQLDIAQAVWVVYSQRRYLSARARAFIAHLRGALPAHLA